MASIATLAIDLTANIASLRTGMEQATSVVKGFQRDVDRSIGMVKGAFASIGAGLSVAGFAMLIKRSAEAADQMAAMSQAIGISTDELQRYRYAADLSGVSTEKMDGALARAAKSIGDARSGTGELITYLKGYDQQLLASLRNTSNMDDALKLMFDAVSKAKDPMDRAALSAALFGRQAGIYMVNMVANGTKALEDLKNQADRVGAVLGQQDVAALNTVNDKFDELHKVVDTQLSRSLVSLQPLLLDTANGLEAMARGAADFFNSFRTVDQQNSIPVLQGQLEDLIRQRDQIESRLKGGGGLWGFLIPKSADQQALKWVDGQIALIEQRIQTLNHIANQGAGQNTPSALAPDPDAVKQVDAFTKHLRNLSDTYGLSAIAALKYRIEQGDINDELNAMGPAGVKTRAVLEGIIERLLTLQNQAADATAKLKALDAEFRLGDQVTAANLTTLESFSGEIMTLNKLWQDGAIDADTYYAAVTKANAHAQQSFMQGQSLVLNSIANTANNAAQLLDVLGQRSKGAALAALAINKALAIAETVINTQAASMRALAELGPFAGPPAVATIEAMGAASIGLIAATGLVQAHQMIQPKGQFHGGIDSVPTTGTYLLQKGERVVKQSDNQDLANFMRRGGGAPHVTINLIASAIDARGLDQVLMARAPVIAAAVQSQYNRAGRSGGPIR